MSTPPVGVRVDDRDPRVKFTGVWPLGGSPSEYKETVSSSTRVGDSFVVPFYGNSIVVYGTIDATSGGVITNYSIDGGPPEQVVSQRASGDTYNQQFWASPVQTITQHNLVVTMAKVNLDAEPGEGTIWFDYFIAYDPSGHEGVAPSRGLSKGGIAGVVLGCLGFILIILGSVIWYIRRRRSKKEGEGHYYQNTRERGFRNKEVEGADAQQSRENRERFSGGRQWYSRNGVQPFVLGLSTSPYAGEPPRSPPVVHGGGDRKRAMAQNTVAITASASSSSRSASVVSVPTSIGKSHTTSRVEMDSLGGLSLGMRPTPMRSQSPRSLTTQDGSEESISISSSSTGWQNQALGDARPVLISPQSLSGISEEARENPLGGPGIHQAPINDIVQSNSHKDGSGKSGGPAVRIMMINPTDLGRNGDVAEGSSERRTLRHVDSGVRLSEEPGVPVELPPVYSQL